MLKIFGKLVGAVFGYFGLLVVSLAFAFALAAPGLIGLAVFVYLSNAVFGP